MLNVTATAASQSKSGPFMERINKVLHGKIIKSPVMKPDSIFPELDNFFKTISEKKSKKALRLYIRLLVKALQYYMDFGIRGEQTVEDLKHHSIVLRLMDNNTGNLHKPFSVLYTTIDQLLASDYSVDIKSFQTQFLEDYKESMKAELDLADLKK